jgi:hypothetical protein
MQDSRTERERIRQPLYVGRIISQTFSILFRRIGYVLVFVGIPALALAYAQYRLIPSQPLEGPIIIAPERSNEAAMTLVLSLFGSLIVALITALMAKLVIDEKNGQPVGFARLFIATSKALPRTFTMLLLIIAGIAIAAVLVAAGFFMTLNPDDTQIWLLLIPFYFVVLSIWTLFYVALPASIIEKVWISSFARSLHLTKDYRWACFGVLLVTGIGAYTIIAIFDALYLFFDYPFDRRLVPLVKDTATFIVLPACMASAASLTYMRLREIKEFGIAEDVGKVFA